MVAYILRNVFCWHASLPPWKCSTRSLLFAKLIWPMLFIFTIIWSY